MIEPEARIDGEPVSYRYTVGHEQGLGYKLSAGDRRSAGDGLIRLSALVDVPDTRRNDYGLTVLALFNFHAELPGVTGP